DYAKRFSGVGRTDYRYRNLDPFAEPDEAAVPVLVALLGDGRPAVRRYAAFNLGTIGPPAHDAVPALCALLRDAAADRGAEGFDWSVRRTAAWALRSIDPETGAQAEATRD